MLYARKDTAWVRKFPARPKGGRKLPDGRTGPPAEFPCLSRSLTGKQGLAGAGCASVNGRQNSVLLWTYRRFKSCMEVQHEIVRSCVNGGCSHSPFRRCRLCTGTRHGSRYASGVGRMGPGMMGGWDWVSVPPKVARSEECRMDQGAQGNLCPEGNLWPSIRPIRKSSTPICLM